MNGSDRVLPHPTLAEDVTWIRVGDASSPGAVRRRAVELAERVGLDRDRTGEVAIAITELATNLVKYAEDGLVLLRLLRRGGLGGIELVAVDAGPGMRDVHALFQDGRSTTGTLGIGLGAVHRLASAYDVASTVGVGTVIVASFWQDPPEPPAPVAGLTRALEGETECGDAYAVRLTDRGYLLLLCDGLGHGHLAAHAAREGTRCFRESAEESPAALLREMHRAMTATRGAAAAVAHVDLTAVRVTYAGVGNIAGRIVGHGRSRGLMSVPGIVGHNLRTVNDVNYDLEDGSLVVMHSDGLTDKWDIGRYPGLLARSPLVVAATLMRDAAVRRDDASVLVCQVGGR